MKENSIIPGMLKGSLKVLMVLVLLGMTFPVMAQYELYNWINVEKGKLPDSVFLLGKFADKGLEIVNYKNVKNMPQAFYNAGENNETGQYGLQMKGDPEIYMCGIADNLILDRGRLGLNGRALFQADFYLPPEEEYLPSLAVLAMRQPPAGDVVPRDFYRFGLTRNRFLYFSHVESEAEQALIFEQDAQLIKELPRPGWHRFSIVFAGPSKIHCYIDGIETSFSPVEDTTIDKLQVGLFLAERDVEYMCYADNLNIQWTPEEARIPHSPYASSWGSRAPSAPPSAPAYNPAPVTNNTPGSSQVNIQWTDPQTAWDNSQKTRKPVLVYFYAPGIPAVQSLDQIFQTNTEAKAFLSNYSLTKIDINQLQGGQIAKTFQIFKIPTIMILDLQGNPTKKVIFSRYDDWQKLKTKLQ